MKTKLFLAVTLCTLAATANAADGYDKTGSAAFTARAHISSQSGTYAANGVDKSITVTVADGVEKTGSADAID